MFTRILSRRSGRAKEKAYLYKLSKLTKIEMILSSHKAIEQEISDALMDIAPSTMRAYAVIYDGKTMRSAKDMADYLGWYFREIFKVKTGTTTSEICKLLPDMIHHIEDIIFCHFNAPKDEETERILEFFDNAPPF
jgi:hypothetical protein